MYKNIKLIKLITGDTLVGEVIGTNTEGYMYNNVLMLIMVESGLRFIPYISMAMSSSCVISNDKIITIVDAHPIIQKYYLLSIDHCDAMSEEILERVNYTNSSIEFDLFLDNIELHRFVDESESIH